MECSSMSSAGTADRADVVMHCSMEFGIEVAWMSCHRS